MNLKLFLVAAFLFALIFNFSSVQAQSKISTRKYPNSREAIYALIDTVSKSGINSGEWLKTTTAANPNLKADLEKWMSTYGEGVTSVKPWKITTELIPASGGAPAITINFTTKNDAVYVLVRGAMRDMMIRSLAISGSLKAMDIIKMLGSAERISWEQQEHALTLEKPDVLASQDAVVFKITFQDYYKSHGTEH